MVRSRIRRSLGAADQIARIISFSSVRICSSTALPNSPSRIRFGSTHAASSVGLDRFSEALCLLGEAFCASLFVLMSLGERDLVHWPIEDRGEHRLVVVVAGDLRIAAVTARVFVAGASRDVRLRDFRASSVVDVQLLVWYVYHHCVFLFGTGWRSRCGRCLGVRAACGFELASSLRAGSGSGCSPSHYLTMVEHMDVLDPSESSAKCNGASISKGPDLR